MFTQISVPYFLTGLLIAVLCGTAYHNDEVRHLFNTHTDDHSHESSQEVHFHADVAIFINEEQLDLTDDKYMSGSNQMLADSVHLHDNNDDIIHFHDNGITLPSFLDSIGLTLTTDCLILDTKEVYCTDETNELVILSNNERVTDTTTFLPEDEDQVLIYYGPNNTDLSPFTGQITADSCIYSLTCPEKGTPPPESCGLTCEI